MASRRGNDLSVGTFQTFHFAGVLVTHADFAAALGANQTLPSLSTVIPYADPTSSL